MSLRIRQAAFLDITFAMVLDRQEIHQRIRICRACLKHCTERAALDLSDSRTVCPLDLFPHPASPAPALLGDVLAAKIETHILRPAAAYAPGIVAAVRKCGGCQQARHALGTAKPSEQGPIV